MKIRDFISSLLPSFKKDELLEDTTRSLDNLRDVVMPLYDQAAPVFKANKPKSKEVIQLNEDVRRQVKSSGTNIIETIQKNLPTVLTNIEQLVEAMKTNLNDEVAATGLTYKKGNILQLASYTGFLERYSRRLLDYVLVLEVDQTNLYPNHTKENLSKGDQLWVTTKAAEFGRILEIFSLKPDTFLKQLTEIPEMVVATDDNDMALSVTDLSKLDPFKANFIPTGGNPIYRVGMWKAEWQVKRYKEAKEDLAKIKLRILLLEKGLSGRTAPEVERELAYHQTRVEKITYELTKMEERVK